MDIFKRVRHNFGSLRRVISRWMFYHSPRYVQSVLNQCVDITKVPPARGKLRLLQKVDLLLLRLFHAFCQRNGFTYMLAYGTLLGARRHGGFVPWDDDIDTFVLEEEYQQIIDKLEEEIRGTDFCLYGVDKCRLDDTTLRISHRFVPQVNLDIFYLLGSAVEHANRKSLYPEFKKLQAKYLSRYRWHISQTENRTKISDCRNEGDGNLRELIKGCSSADARTLWPDIINNACAYARDDMLPTSKVTFEGYEFCAPNNIEAYLKEEYGDWMSFPSRFDHHGSEFLDFKDEDMLKMISHLEHCLAEGRFL